MALAWVPREHLSLKILHSRIGIDIGPDYKRYSSVGAGRIPDRETVVAGRRRHHRCMNDPPVKCTLVLHQVAHANRGLCIRFGAARS